MLQFQDKCKDANILHSNNSIKLVSANFFLFNLYKKLRGKYSTNKKERKHKEIRPMLDLSFSLRCNSIGVRLSGFCINPDAVTIRIKRKSLPVRLSSFLQACCGSCNIQKCQLFSTCVNLLLYHCFTHCLTYALN